MDNNMTLDDYRKLVEQMMQEVLLSDSNIPRSFTNSGTEHAKVVLDVLTDSTQASLHIISHRLNKQVWDSKKVRALFDRSPSAQIKILVCEKDAISSADSALSDLGDLIKDGKIEVRIAQIPAEITINHVAVSDKQHARIETDPAARKALVSFGNPKLSHSTLAVFGALWTRSEPIS